MNKHLYLCHPLVLSSPTLMMHGHVDQKSSFSLPYIRSSIYYGSHAVNSSVRVLPSVSAILYYILDSQAFLQFTASLEHRDNRNHEYEVTGSQLSFHVNGW